MWRQDARPMYLCALTLNATVFGKALYDNEGSHTSRLELLASQTDDNNGAKWTFLTILIDCHFNGSFQQTSPAFSPTWRSMHLTDTPMTTAMLELHPCPLAVHDPDDVCLHLTDHTGTTLGLLYDTIFATFEAQCGATMEHSDLKHFFASLHFVSADASLSTGILVLE